MAAGAPQIPLCMPGGSSLISASYANQLITPINGLLNGTVAPIASVGSMLYSGGAFVLDLSPIDQRVRKLERAGLRASKWHPAVVVVEQLHVGSVESTERSALNLLRELSPHLEDVARLRIP